jgi:hypothetical protein
VLEEANFFVACVCFSESPQRFSTYSLTLTTAATVAAGEPFTGHGSQLSVQRRRVFGLLNSLKEELNEKESAVVQRLDNTAVSRCSQCEEITLPEPNVGRWLVRFTSSDDGTFG